MIFYLCTSIKLRIEVCSVAGLGLQVLSHLNCEMMFSHHLLPTYRRIGIIVRSDLVSSCLSIFPHGTVLLPQYKFS
jgi:hypothetical protein